MSKKRKDFFALMVLGPPGSGKGTQIKLLSEKLGFLHLISSQLIKNSIKNNKDPETIRQKERQDKGLLCEPEWVFERVKEKTQEIYNDHDNCKGIIFDGSPRTLYEAEHLYNLLVNLIGKDNIKIMEINISEDELKKRISKRLVCSNSSQHVFIKSEDLKPEMPCPDCDGVLLLRVDDKSEALDIRMQEYINQTLPMLDYLKKNHEVIVINGEQSIDIVHQEIVQKLGL